VVGCEFGSRCESGCVGAAAAGYAVFITPGVCVYVCEYMCVRGWGEHI